MNIFFNIYNNSVPLMKKAAITIFPKTILLYNIIINLNILYPNLSHTYSKTVFWYGPVPQISRISFTV